ncbi:MAG: D-alanyl-D-alanine carboxypeptidase family protein [Cephaloticoccus sp.]|nr:D-alanyl-D-alanine carboxypeptidase family protein [Cephaloticoccus sp.]
MKPATADYQARIAVLLRELGIPGNYAVDRGLKLQPEAAAEELTTIASNSSGTPVQLIRPAAAVWQGLHASAMTAGIALVPLSGFRSVSRQVEIIRHKLNLGDSIPIILTNVAAPGFSEHHTGCALDLGTMGEPDLEESFAETPAYQWLQAHAGDWGFHLSYPRDNPHGIVFEPWHWCWRPA